jgi:DNA-binding NarL/FixJ family response regulator
VRCLIVDDCPESRSLMERLIVRLGYRSFSVPNGMAAVAALNETRYDVALVDLEMPGMSGVETMRALRQADERMRLLVISGRDDRKHVLAAIEAGADGYVIKTELGERLGVALQEVLAGKSPLSSSVAAVLVRARQASKPPLSDLTPPQGEKAIGRAGPSGKVSSNPPAVATPITEAKGNRLSEVAGELEIDVELPSSD